MSSVFFVWETVTNFLLQIIQLKEGTVGVRLRSSSHAMVYIFRVLVLFKVSLVPAWMEIYISGGSPATWAWRSF